MANTTAQYIAITEPSGWSYILGPDGYREGPIRYRWEADEWTEEMNAGKPPPKYMQQKSDIG